MERKYRNISIALTTVFALAAYLFFRLLYPYHVHFQEQYQLFEWTCGYFCQVAAVPGGVADWTGRCLTQFFYYAGAGSTIIAIVLTGIQLAIWLNCKDCNRKGNSSENKGNTGKNLLTYILSFLPAITMWLFLCDENALMGAPVALLCSLLTAYGIRSIHSQTLRKVLALILIPVLYWLLGPLSLVYAILVSYKEGVVFCLTAIVIALLSPLTAIGCGYPLHRLATGVHYHRYHHVVQLFVWLSAALAIAVQLVSDAAKNTAQRPWKTICLLSMEVLALVLGVYTCSDFRKEDEMKYDFMVSHQMWNRIMMTADKKQPQSPLTVACLNLALGQSGRMADYAFTYFQNGPDGLLPEFVRDFISPLPTAEAYYQLGMVNTAQRYTFEAQEAIPDFQKSARCYKRLAETNYINGDTAVAEKYLKALKHTLFYRKWALTFPQDKQYDALRNFRLKEHDFLFSQTEMDSMLGLLFVEHNNNRLAFDYLLHWCLLTKDLQRFQQCLGLKAYPKLPKHYQEALMLLWAQTQTADTPLPAYLSQDMAKRFSAFIQTSQKGVDVATMQRQFGDTYWFYYYYRYKSANEKSDTAGSNAHGSGV